MAVLASLCTCSITSLGIGNSVHDDLDEEQEADEDMLLSCLLVGEYLSEKE